ncbi:hypothetical protein LDENG_00217350 [Lucifuga dentata]|nr:hypothetical protein LDENG_00217350 [Lucifuga dentata]
MWSVLFLFLSYLDRNFIKGELVEAENSKDMFSTFCAKMSPAGQNYLYQVSDGAQEVISVVSPAGKLVNCSVIQNPLRAKSFLSACRLEQKNRRSGGDLETPFARTDEAKMMCREFKEKSERRGRTDEAGNENFASQDKVVKRSKRGFTYPGTLWCGAGNMADHYNQLGEFAETDSCCRIHDHCPHVIHAFSSKYGHANFKWHSICHCDCDNALKDCLRKVNDTTSRVIGQAFFNVISVPCFELVYEERCAERHWYGLCKRYEKLPIAELKEAIPYDFGGIDVIDVLTMAPPRTKDSKQSAEQEKPESTAKSAAFPEEPSLRNVVTAAEDFIKVLATVSTSQSSTADLAKGETQSSDKKKKKKKKKKKNIGKRKKNSKKQNGKGKGRKRKQKVDAGVKMEEGVPIFPSGGQSEVNEKSNFIHDRNNLSSRNTNRISDTEYELGSKEERSNEVMKDEPVLETETDDVSFTSPVTVHKKLQDSDTLTANTEIIPLSIPTNTNTATHATKPRKSRKGMRKNNKTTPAHFPVDESNIKEKSLMKTDDLSNTSVPTVVTIKAEQQTSSSHAETRPVVSAASHRIVTPKMKSSSSKEGEGRKKRRKVSSAAPIVAVAHENSSADNLKAIPLSQPAITPSFHAEATQISHGPDAFKSAFSAVKRKKQRSKDKRLRKTCLLNQPPAVTMVNGEETQSEWRRFTATTSVITERDGTTARPERKPAAVLHDRLIFPDDSETAATPATFTKLHVAAMPDKCDETEEFPGQ